MKRCSLSAAVNGAGHGKQEKIIGRGSELRGEGSRLSLIFPTFGSGRAELPPPVPDDFCLPESLKPNPVPCPAPEPLR